MLIVKEMMVDGGCQNADADGTDGHGPTQTRTDGQDGGQAGGRGRLPGCRTVKYDNAA